MIDAIHPLSRCEIGIQIPTAKAIDRLFGIPNQQQQMRRAVAEGTTQQPPLHGVRVLKLIHHHGAVALLKRNQPGGFSLAGVQGRQQSPEGDHPAPAATGGQFSEAFLQQIQPDPFDHPIPERSDGLLQSRGHKAGIRLPTFAGHAAPTAGMEVLLQRFFDRCNRLQRGPRPLLKDPLMDQSTAIRTGFGAVGSTGPDSQGLPLLGSRAKTRLQLRMVPLPEGKKVSPGGRDPTLQLGGEGLVNLQVIIVGLQLRPDITIQLHKAATQAVRGQSPLTQATEFSDGEGE